jgi:hypothetical protein
MDPIVFSSQLLESCPGHRMMRCISVMIYCDMESYTTYNLSSNVVYFLGDILNPVVKVTFGLPPEVVHKTAL